MRSIVIELIIIVITAAAQIGFGVTTIRPNNTALLQNHQLVLNCSSDSLSYTEFIWYKINDLGVPVNSLGLCANDPSLEGYGYRYEKGGTYCNLVVDSVNASHAGAFRCNPIGETQVSAAVNVIDELSIAVNGSTIATTGDDIVLECKVTHNGYMIPDLTWSTPSNIIETPFYTRHAPGESVSTLAITSDFPGRYDITCSVAFNASTISINDLNPTYMTSSITSQPFQVTVKSEVPILHCKFSDGEVAGIGVGCAAGGALITIGTVAILVKFEIMSWHPNSGTNS